MVLNRDFEVAHQITGEVVAGQLIQQFILIDRIGRISQHKHERRIALITELLRFSRRIRSLHLCTPRPHLTDVELSATQGLTGFDAIDNHTGQRSQLTIGVFGDQRVEVSQTTLTVAIIEFGQSSDEHKLITVGAKREMHLRQLGVGFHLTEAVGLERIIGGRIERILQMDALTRITHEVGIGEQRRPLAMWITRFQTVDILLSHSGFSFARIEQEQMIESIIHMLIARVVVGESAQRLLAERQVVELILEDDATIVETIHDNQVAGLLGFRRKRYILEIVFPLVRVIFGVLHHLVDGVLTRLLSLHLRALLIGNLTAVTVVHSGDHRLIVALPVVDILALTPELLELLLTLRDSYRTVEIPVL